MTKRQNQEKQIVMNSIFRKGLRIKAIYPQFLLGLLIILNVACTKTQEESLNEKGLKDYYDGYYKIGVAIPSQYLNDTVEGQFIARHFNSMTMENEMKWMHIHPSLGEYNFEPADKFVNWGTEHGMFLVGHTLVWHSQLAPDVFKREETGNPAVDTLLVDSLTLMTRMKDHIETIVGRYKGKIQSWDVVNEALEEDGSLRKSNFYNIAGEGFIEKAFEWANQADPDAELYYNDYNLVEPAKRDGAIEIVKGLKEKGLRIDGVGVQAHWELNYPSLEKIEEAILKYSEQGVKVMFTELDVSVLPSPWRMPSADVSIKFENNPTMNPYPDGIPDSVNAALAKRYADIFALFNKHKDKISRVTFWGLHDGVSWKNDFPIQGRTDYTLLFDRNLEPKEAYTEVINLVKEQ